MGPLAQRITVERLVVPAVVVLVLVGLPWLNPGYRYLSIATSTGISAIALYGLAILFGQAGIMSVRHAALMRGRRLYRRHPRPRSRHQSVAGAPVSALFSAIVAGLLGLPSLCA